MVMYCNILIHKLHSVKKPMLTTWYTLYWKRYIPYVIVHRYRLNLTVQLLYYITSSIFSYLYAACPVLFLNKILFKLKIIASHQTNSTPALCRFCRKIRHVVQLLSVSHRNSVSLSVSSIVLWKISQYYHLLRLIWQIQLRTILIWHEKQSCSTRFACFTKKSYFSAQVLSESARIATYCVSS